ncbi:MAG: LytTR family transcriptional regulator DNA-binding domain-containing protein [Lachnospiraceae bacterium]|nr:LytTR family transcriptional regulator DNA-binding domain-containing protein [Lachnospiraceae bacterium]
MKVILEKVSSPEDERAIIKAAEVTEEIRSAMDLLENNCRSILVSELSDERSTGETIMLGTDKIYYTESIDKKTFVYTKEKCYGSKLRLYELEETLSSNFFRCSKSLIVNIRKIRSVKSELNGRMIAELLNGEQLVISRSYVKDLKRKLGV